MLGSGPISGMSTSQIEALVRESANLRLPILLVEVLWNGLRLDLWMFSSSGGGGGETWNHKFDVEFLDVVSFEVDLETVELW